MSEDPPTDVSSTSNTATIESEPRPQEALIDLPVSTATTTTTTTTSSPDDTTTTTSTPTQLSVEELIELVRAIQFGSSDSTTTVLSQTKVFKEITQNLSQKDGYGFLKHVKFNDVKKAWKQWYQQEQGELNDEGKGTSQRQSSETTGTTTTTTTTTTTANKNPNDITPSTGSVNHSDLLEKLRAQNQPPQLYTVGDPMSYVPSTTSPSSLATLIRELLPSSALLSKEGNENTHDNKLSSDEEEHKNYVHFFLNIPFDQSGSKPHQALINFQSRATTTTVTTISTTTAKTTSAKKNKKQSGKKKKTTTMTTTKATTPTAATATTDEAVVGSEGKKETNDPRLVEQRMIVKIQQAAPTSETDTAQYPMLLYDESRTYKTFLHPKRTNEDGTNTNNNNSNDDDDYDRIVKWMKQAGQGGVLGQTGGSKAYFYVQLTITKKGVPDIVSIDVSQLAPTQEW